MLFLLLFGILDCVLCAHERIKDSEYKVEFNKKILTKLVIKILIFLIKI